MISLNSFLFTLVLFGAPLVLIPRSPWRNLIFLALNLVIYAFTITEPTQALVALLWIILPYFLSKIIKKPSVLIIPLVIGFIYLNRYGWIVESLGIPYLFMFRLFGLSYILFRQIDFILNRSMIAPQRITLVDYLNYLLSFYTLLAGPLLNYETFIEHFYHPLALDKAQIYKSLNRIFTGYIKVFILSALFSMVSKNAYRELQSGFAFLPLLSLAITNTFFIYFNFSGYCDVVIGAGRLAGFTIDENFDKPYLSQDISDFWSRWHMSLTHWITAYVFTPLVKWMIRYEWISMNMAQYMAFIITFMIAGLWHGTTMNYIVYGLLQAIGVALSKGYADLMSKKLGGKKALREYRKRPLVRVIEIGVTLCYVGFSLVFVGFDILALLN